MSDLTSADVCRLCKVSPSTVRRWIASGKLKATASGQRSSWKTTTRDDLISFLQGDNRTIPAELIAAKSYSRSTAADAAWRRIVRDPRTGAPERRTFKTKAIRMLDANLQALSVLTPLERIGFVQAAQDVVDDFAKMEVTK